MLEYRLRDKGETWSQWHKALSPDMNLVELLKPKGRLCVSIKYLGADNKTTKYVQWRRKDGQSTGNGKVEGF